MDPLVHVEPLFYALIKFTATVLALGRKSVKCASL